MKPTPQDITARLHTKADNELNSFIDAQLQPLWDKFESFGRDHQGAGQVSISQNENEKPHWWGEDWMGLKKAAFQALQHGWREKTVGEFMTKVETLSAQVEELKNTVENIPQ